MKTSWLSRFLDLIGPRQCALCGRRLVPTESVVCASCHLTMPVTGFADNPTDNPMARLFWGVMPVERVAALFFYRRSADVAMMIHDLKYHHQPGLARRIGAYMARQMADSQFFEGIDTLVPVPLTRRRQWQRGYNQSLEICRGIKEVTGISVCSGAIRRTAFNSSQTRLTGFERRDNVETAFRLTGRAAQLANKHVLLVDDVVTTGATMTACGLQLSQIEGIKISILSLAVVKTSNIS